MLQIKNFLRLHFVNYDYWTDPNTDSEKYRYKNDGEDKHPK